MRFELNIKPAGTRMDDEPLYNLTVVDTQQAIDWLKSTLYEELTKTEVEWYVARFTL